jgi:hypothetical protein
MSQPEVADGLGGKGSLQADREVSAKVEDYDWTMGEAGKDV